MNKLLSKVFKLALGDVEEQSTPIPEGEYTVEVSKDKKILNSSIVEARCKLSNLNWVLREISLDLRVPYPEWLYDILVTSDPSVSELETILEDKHYDNGQHIVTEYYQYAYELVRHYTNYINIFNTRIKFDDVMDKIIEQANNTEEKILKQFVNQQVHQYLYYWHVRLGVSTQHASLCEGMPFDDRMVARVDYLNYLTLRGDKANKIITAFYILGILRTNSKAAKLIPAIVERTLSYYDIRFLGDDGQPIPLETLKREVLEYEDEYNSSSLETDVIVFIIRVLDKPVQEYLLKREVKDD